MSRINFAELPLSADQARAARNYFAWSQANAADKSGLPAHKIKRFETGNYVPDEAFLGSLRDFYERSGYTFDDTVKPGTKARQEGLVFPAGVVGEPSAENRAPARPRAEKASIHHMRIALTDDTEMGRLLDMIEDNEEKAQALLRQPVEFGLLGGITETTKRRHAQAMRLLSENGVIFARLFGREVGGTPHEEIIRGKKGPATGAELLHRALADVHLESRGDPEAKERRKTTTLADSIFEAIGLS